jgi:hypothetical protein
MRWRTTQPAIEFEGNEGNHYNSVDPPLSHFRTMVSVTKVRNGAASIDIFDLCYEPLLILDPFIFLYEANLNNNAYKQVK